MKGKWSGDINLNDRELERQYKQYQTQDRLLMIMSIKLQSWVSWRKMCYTRLQVTGIFVHTHKRIYIVYVQPFQGSETLWRKGFHNDNENVAYKGEVWQQCPTEVAVQACLEG